MNHQFLESFKPLASYILNISIRRQLKLQTKNLYLYRSPLNYFRNNYRWKENTYKARSIASYVKESRNITYCFIKGFKQNKIVLSKHYNKYCFLPMLMLPITAKCNFEEEGLSSRKIKLEESGDLSYKQQIKRAAGLTVEAASNLLTRCVLAYLDIANTYKKQLSEVNELYGLLVQVINKEDQHNMVWAMILEKRGEISINKQLLLDLELEIEYANRILNNAAFAVCVMEDEYSVQNANNLMNLSNEQIKKENQEIKEMEDLYNTLQSQHIIATKKLAEDNEKNKIADDNQDLDGHEGTEPLQKQNIYTVSNDSSSTIQDSENNTSNLSSNDYSNNLDVENENNTNLLTSFSYSEKLPDNYDDDNNEMQEDIVNNDYNSAEDEFPFEKGRNFASE